jgi:hypothetical protein
MLLQAAGQVTETLGELIRIGGSRVGGGELTLAASAGSGVGHGSSASGAAVFAGAGAVVPLSAT